MNNIKVAIHQPSFFPWPGFFDKIIQSDVFVILDNVQFPKTGGFWGNRVKIIISARDEWMTMPIIRSYSGLRNINEMEINNSTPWREKMVKTISINYKRAPCFEEIFPLIENLINYSTNSLIEFNLNIIKSICNLLQIENFSLVLGSSLNTMGKATDLLISIINALNGKAYICGGGASKYQEDEKFEQAGIKLTYQNFQQPVYKQFNSQSFIHGLSIIDMFMNCGIEETRQILTENAARQTSVKDE